MHFSAAISSHVLAVRLSRGERAIKVKLEIRFEIFAQCNEGGIFLLLIAPINASAVFL